MSTLDVLLVFVGIPLLVIAAVSLLVYAPSWVKGPRYRPGQSWDASAEWFGASAVRLPVTGAAAGATRSSTSGNTAAATGTTRLQDSVGAEDTRELHGQSDLGPDPRPGGASAGW